jgi:hypothetical protein
MLIFKVLFLQLFWLAIVFFGTSLNSILLIGASICLGVINYSVYKPTISIGRFFLSLFYTQHSDTYMIHH